jgi:tetratricopeptide (TPR) repeat protein
MLDHEKGIMGSPLRRGGSRRPSLTRILRTLCFVIFPSIALAAWAHAAKKCAVGDPTCSLDYGYEYAAELRPQSLDGPKLADVRSLIETQDYLQARKALEKLSKGQKPVSPMARLANRLELVSFYYQDWPGPHSPWDDIVASAIHEFLQGHDRRAVMKASYALSLNRSNVRIDHFLTDMEKAVGIKAERLPEDSTKSFVDEMLERVEAASGRQEVQTANQLLQDILDLDGQNVLTAEKVGSMYYMLGRYEDAAEVWRNALDLEKNPAKIQSLQHHINLALQRRSEDAAAAAAPAAALSTAPAAALAPAAPAAPSAHNATSPADLERLFQRGMDQYARGENLQATAMFMRILQLDPNNAKALKALELIEKKTPGGPIP